MIDSAQNIEGTMMQAVKIIVEPTAVPGTSTVVESIFNLPDDTKIYWAGSRIYAKRPCGKDIVISKVDVFCEGKLEKGEYIRKKSIPISNRVPPTIKERNLSYQIRSEISMVKPGARSEEEYFFAESPIILKAVPLKPEKSHPVEVSMTGIKIHIEKDLFQPGETIKIDYELEKIRNLEVDLVKDSMLTCYCPEYAPTCVHIIPKPPSVHKGVNASNLTAGTLQVPLPSPIEFSHRYLWEPPEKTRWKETFGDYVNWLLEVIGTRTSGDIVKFQIPITIVGKKSSTDSDFFTSKDATSPLLIKVLLPDLIQVTNPGLDQNKLTITLKNKSKKVLNGVTVKIVPIESEFFELPPNITGVNEWKPDTEIQAHHTNVRKSQNFQIFIEDNNGNSINKRINL